jgi:gas vesicle protein
MAERDEFSAFLLGFIIGGLTGAVVSLIMAPQSGEETREIIRDRAIELRDKAQETAQVAKEQVNTTAGDLAQRSQVILEEQRARFSSKTGDTPVQVE